MLFREMLNAHIKNHMRHTQEHTSVPKKSSHLTVLDCIRTRSPTLRTHKYFATWELCASVSTVCVCTHTHTWPEYGSKKQYVT